MEGLPHKPVGLPAQQYERWEEEAKELITGTMMRRKVRYKQLSRELEKLGIYESAEQISRKINRGKFSGAFLIACLHAMGVGGVSLTQFK